MYDFKRDEPEDTFLLAAPVEKPESWDDSDDSIGELSTVHDNMADGWSDDSIEIEVIDATAKHLTEAERSREAIDSIMAELGDNQIEDFFKKS